MKKDFLKQFTPEACKTFFKSLGKTIGFSKPKKPDPSVLKKIRLPKVKKPSFLRLKKVSAPKWLKKITEGLKKIFSKKLVSRLSVGLCAVALVGVFILWDLGLISLPFLVRRERREPLTETETKEDTSSTTEKKEGEQSDPAASLAIDTIRSLYAFAGVNTLKTPVTDLPYQSDSMTLTKQVLPEGSYTTAMGFVVKTDNGTELLFTAPDLQEMLDSEGYHLTHYRNYDGTAVFKKDGETGYFSYDTVNRVFIPIPFDPLSYPHLSITTPLPRSYGQSDEGKELISENGLYGYQGTYTDGRRTKKFSVDPIYPTAFAYSEGFAVMADANGTVTIRNERGEEVFTEYNFILPDVKEEEALGFSYFDGGILRVIVAGYDADGNLTSRRETMINTRGQEVSLPAGYSVVSLHEGILLVTDGEYYGYLSAKGAWIAPPVYTAASPFYEGFAVVTDKAGKMGLLDSEGKTVLPCAFDLITDFSDGNGLCYSKATGWYLLTKVDGIYYHDPSREEGPLNTKMTITRGPQNTFDYEPDIIIEFPPVLSTTPRTTHPENTTSQAIK
ncbi:MAG: WG repeat-containing protein [Clostridia bacterium]|nr:WG repeat-containing protein [Clostridia bacterium]